MTRNRNGVSKLSRPKTLSGPGYQGFHTRYETFSRNKALTPRQLERAPEMKIFGMKEASKGLLQFLGETHVGLASNEASAQAERERRESECGIEDFDQEEGEFSNLLFALSMTVF